MKNANQIYRQYKEGGGQLIFREWIEREKKKDFFNLTGTQAVPVNTPLSDSIQKVLTDLHKESGYQDRLTGKYILGINKYVWITLGGLALAGATYLIIKNYKK